MVSLPWNMTHRVVMENGKRIFFHKGSRIQIRFYRWGAQAMIIQLASDHHYAFSSIKKTCTRSQRSNQNCREKYYVAVLMQLCDTDFNTDRSKLTQLLFYFIRRCGHRREKKPVCPSPIAGRKSSLIIWSSPIVSAPFFDYN